MYVSSSTYSTKRLRNSVERIVARRERSARDKTAPTRSAAESARDGPRPRGESGAGGRRGVRAVARGWSRRECARRSAARARAGGLVAHRPSLSSPHALGRAGAAVRAAALVAAREGPLTVRRRPTSRRRRSRRSRGARTAASSRSRWSRRVREDLRPAPRRLLLLPRRDQRQRVAVAEARPARAARHRARGADVHGLEQDRDPAAVRDAAAVGRASARARRWRPS